VINADRLNQSVFKGLVGLSSTSIAFALLGGIAGAATVISVGDGDTLRVRDGGRLLTIRMACIDAPEIAQKPYGARAREALQRLAPVGTEVALQIQTTDRYGRSVAEVYRGGANLNLGMVRQGAEQGPRPQHYGIRVAAAQLRS
jgi:endonuclease YncB( thermonuclease family)